MPFRAARKLLLGPCNLECDNRFYINCFEICINGIIYGNCVGRLPSFIDVKRVKVHLRSKI